MIRSARFLLLGLLASSAPLGAQSTYTAKTIVFKNHGPFSQAQLEGVAGIHPGVKFKAADLNAAAQRLVDSSYFENVTATLDGSIAGVTVIFELKPLAETDLLPTGFENFVWLTHAEIEAAIAPKVPLFIDALPESSPEADTINAALTEALAAKGIKAEVTHETVEPTLLHPRRVIEFRVKNPRIHVAAIRLGAVNTDLVPLVQKSVNATAGTPYNEGLAGEVTSERILAPLLDAGYADASLKDVSLVPSPEASGIVTVGLTAALHPGEIYHVSHLAYAGSPLVSAESFGSTQKLHDGDLASRKVLLETIAPLDTAYRRQGYIDVVINTTPKLDPATHQVAYTVSVVPGEQYRLHDVRAEGLDSAARTDFDRGFIMKTGDLYNPEYVASFIKNNTALRGLAHYTGSFKAYADPNTHTVDLVITFFAGASVTVHGS